LLQLDDWRTDIEEIERMAAAHHIAIAALTAAEARITLSVFEGDMAAMHIAGERALALARSLKSVSAEARISNVFGKLLCGLMGHTAHATALLQAALRGATQIKDTALHVSVLCNLSAAQLQAGQGHAARESALRALTLSQLAPRHYAARADALQALGCAEWQLGEWQAAQATLHAAMQLHAASHNMWALTETTLYWCLLNAHMGDHAVACIAVEQLLAIARNVGLSAQSDLYLWAEAVQVNVWVQAGDVDKARLLVARLVDWVGACRAPATIPLLDALQAIGRFYLEAGQPQQALPFLQRAKRILEKPNAQHMTDVEVLLLLVRAAKQAQEPAMADEALRLAERRLGMCDAVSRQMQARIACVRNGANCAGAAVAEGEGKSSVCSSVEVLLARADMQLGKALNGDEKVCVRWTVDAGEADALTLRRFGKAGLRRVRLQRLLREAAAQGAVPTDADLAKVLNVNVRTIERDMAALKCLNVPVATRRRR
jgi:tetratricopeptide (TPR) repeat protein